MKKLVFTPAIEARFRKDWIDPTIAMKMLEARYDATNSTLVKIARDMGMGLRKVDPWTDDFVAEISRRYVDGESATDMAREFGLTRNQVCSKLDRLGLLRRKPAPTAPVQLAAPVPRLRIAGRGMVFEGVAPRAPRFAPPERPEEPGARTIHTLRDRDCKWPIGDPGAENFSYCGAATARGSYCGTHAEIAFVPGGPAKPRPYVARTA